ncbi:MAG: thiolase family protein [Lentihominibacter sp.]|jgi:acetyl-CoA C-acetyltransferase
MRSVVIVSAARLAGGSFGGSLKNYSATDMGGLCINGAVKRSGLAPENIGQAIIGNGWQADVGPNPARIAVIKGNLPDSCPAFTVNIRCGSGLRTVQLGVLSVAAGEEDVVLAGGMESSSNAPFYAEGERWGARMGDKRLIDALHRDGFQCSLAGMKMGATAELLAEKYNISREEQDEYSLKSQEKALAAVKNGVFRDEIIPVEVKKKKEIFTFDTDEIPRETTIEKMAKLPTIFKENGTVTAASSSALCDSAAMVVLAAEDVAEKKGLEPMARVISYSYVSIDPRYMGLAPIKAIPRALQKAGLTLDDMAIIELNEAFAAQVIACDRELNFDKSKLNIYGGAISLGHPVGATGAKLLTTLTYALKNQGKKYGLVSLCIGGGQGVAMIIENISS